MFDWRILLVLFYLSSILINIAKLTSHTIIVFTFVIGLMDVVQLASHTIIFL